MSSILAAVLLLFSVRAAVLLLSSIRATVPPVLFLGSCPHRVLYLSSCPSHVHFQEKCLTPVLYLGSYPHPVLCQGSGPPTVLCQGSCPPPVLCQDKLASSFLLSFSCPPSVLYLSSCPPPVVCLKVGDLFLFSFLDRYTSAVVCLSSIPASAVLYLSAVLLLSSVRAAVPTSILYLGIYLPNVLCQDKLASSCPLHIFSAVLLHCSIGAAFLLLSYVTAVPPSSIRAVVLPLLYLGSCHPLDLYLASCPSPVLCLSSCPPPFFHCISDPLTLSYLPLVPSLVGLQKLIFHP